MLPELKLKLDRITEELNNELRRKAPDWISTRSSSELYDFEQQLQRMLNALQAEIVKLVLEAIHQDHDFVAQCKAQAFEQVGAIHKFNRNVQVQTLGGLYITIKTPYALIPKVVEHTEPEVSRRRNRVGLFPVMRRLGVIQGKTPRLLSEIARHFVDGPSLAEASERLAGREVYIPSNSLHRAAQEFASVALWQRQQAVNNIAKSESQEPAPLAGKHVVVGIDGGRLRIRIGKQSHDQKKTRDYTSSECEPKLYAIYTVDKDGKKKDSEGILYDGTVLGSRHLFALLRYQLQKMGVSQAKSLVITGDGAPWIWNGFAKLKFMLSLDSVQVFEVVDFAHSVSKLTEPARLVSTKVAYQRAWFKRMRNMLKKGQVDNIIAELLDIERKQNPNEEIRKAIAYFQTHKMRMQYAKFRSEGIPIGSGIIESGVRRIVNLRMKAASISWLPETAEGLLHLRCQAKSGRWKIFFISALSQWAEDMSITFSQANEILGEIRTAFFEEHPPEIINNTRHNTIKWASSLLESKSTVIIDTETTGLSENDEIIQLTIIDLQGNILLETLLKPVQPISAEASEVHGITIESVANSPTFCDLYTEITRLLYEQAVVAYNAAFDQRMLAQTCRKYGLPDINSSDWHCAMNKYSQYWSGQSDTNNRLQSLSSACHQQGIPINGIHDATNDCLLTLQLIKAMAETDPKGISDLKQNLSPSKN